MAAWRPGSSLGLEPDLLRALELQDLARLVGARDLQAQAFDDLAHLAALLRVAFRECSSSEPQAVLEADAHVAAEPRRDCRDAQLVPPGAQHRPLVVVAEEPV